ncbi:MAG: hypothetical protein FJ206_04630 [Gemmatimonadetes bacterium]|nr:hypothetical protein [Gemmatimonadota bacterium]
MRPTGWGIVLAGLVAGCRGVEPARLPGALDEAGKRAIADTVRAESNRMLVAMAARQIDSVLRFYGRQTAYVGEGEIGDWGAIVASAPPRYASYTHLDCRWEDPFRVDVLSRTSAVVTAILSCEKGNQAGERWLERVARTEVLAPEEGRWRIVAVHESMKPGTGALR